MAHRSIPWRTKSYLGRKKFNEKRQGLVKVDLLMLNESMSGWRPKTSKLGGLPNFTFEARKPMPLGTMFRNAVECITGLLVFQDVVQNPEMQSCKSYFNEELLPPGYPPTAAHAAEVLRQVEGAQIAEGGWVGGDAWFGSVLSAVEVMKRLKVHSTFIIKNNHSFFPMEAVHAVLKACFQDRPAGHWVVFHSVITGVKVMALAHAWSQRGVSHKILTCGSTEKHHTKH
jgi:hypothetical protein